jgi:CRISPR/Cas system-associated endoribonuclease Cas2
MGRKKLEKIIKEIRVRIQPSLYEKLLLKSSNEYKSISETIRNLIQDYTKDM